MRNRARFARGLHIAWLDDAPEGYRASARGEWQIRRVEDVTVDHELGRRVDVTVLAGASESAPRLVVEPARRGTARVWSTSELIVHEDGEVFPRLGAASEVVAPGTVVRAGPVTAAVLTAAQAEAVSSGSLMLPRPPADRDEVAANGRDPSLDLEHHVIARRLKVWNVCFAAAMLAATAAAAWLALAYDIPLKGRCSGVGVNDLGGVIAVVGLAWLVVGVVSFPLRALVQLPSRRA